MDDLDNIMKNHMNTYPFKMYHVVMKTTEGSQVFGAMHLDGSTEKRMKTLCGKKVNSEWVFRSTSKIRRENLCKKCVGIEIKRKKNHVN